MRGVGDRWRAPPGALKIIVKTIRCNSVVFEDVFYFVLYSPLRGVPGEGPVCHFPQGFGSIGPIPARIREVILGQFRPGSGSYWADSATDPGGSVLLTLILALIAWAPAVGSRNKFPGYSAVRSFLMLRDSASGPEIGLPGRIGKPQNRFPAGRRADFPD